jgi:hypothetical protein
MASDHDPKLDEPGWNDRLRGDERVWNGEDHIDLRSPLAWRVWGAVLCTHIDRKQPPVRSINESSGRLGWFHLRLTRQECDDLYTSAVARRLIEPAPNETFPPSSDQPEDVVYRLTDAGEQLKAPRGAGIADWVKRAPEVIERLYKIANIIFGTAVTTVLGGVGVALAAKTPQAFVACIWGAWGILLAFVVGAYQDERGLRACAKAWPRMEFYRPKRYKQARSVLRTPLPFAILVWMALAAAWGSAKLIRAHWTPPEPVPSVWVRALLAAAAANLVVLIVLLLRSARMREAYRGEYRRRRPEFWPATKPADKPREPWSRRAQRVARQTARSPLRASRPAERPAVDLAETNHTEAG